MQRRPRPWLLLVLSLLLVTSVASISTVLAAPLRSAPSSLVFSPGVSGAQHPLSTPRTTRVTPRVYHVTPIVHQATPSTKGTITEYPIPRGRSGAVDITQGSDNNLWFTEYNGNNIGKLMPTGTFTEYPTRISVAG